MQGVYGGGNLAAYDPTNSNTPTYVEVDGCDDISIEYVYGGGNAAPVPATEVMVRGAFEIDYVFGGGNGKDKVGGMENPGADVGLKPGGISYGTGNKIGTTLVTVLGGTIHMYSAEVTPKATYQERRCCFGRRGSDFMSSKCR